ncbi:MAG: RsmB/NOP family class I SAM-dependent RNA methyltransferase [Candidatus Pacearchaeota archaeon]|nr:RsmB/NOP family class I SAM-dependent RNA methyltransferase [Candidatus Pacearchaeota archaeon]
MQPKKLFYERMKEMLGIEIEDFFEYSKKPLVPSVRANTIKIAPRELRKRLEKKWKVEQPIEGLPEAFTIHSSLLPGELGKSLEHQLGYYYVQELASMMPPLVLGPKADELVLDLCAAPGSKTTQMAMMMQNRGTIIANDIRIDRLRALNSNLGRCGVTNTITTRMNGIVLCKILARAGFFFDKILVDAPCSGEGTLRSSPATLKIWNLNMIQGLARMQKKLMVAALECLRPQGIIVYSTCTHAPEENELVVDFVLKNFEVKLEQVLLPLKTRPGLTEWQGSQLDQELKKCVRIWPQDNDTEGFFIAKLRKL